MADRVAGMEASLPAKRPRLDFPEESASYKQHQDFQCFAGTSDIISSGYGASGEFGITSDSGFNELTPPQSMEEESNTPRASSSQEDGCSLGLLAQFNGDENTSDSVANTANATSGRKHQDQSTHEDEDDDEENNEDEDDRQSVASTASNLSGLSDLSNLSGKDWKPCAGPMSWVQQQMMRGVNPRQVLHQVLGGSAQIPTGISDMTLWRLIVNMLSEPPRREKLRHINTIEDVVRLIKSCRKVVILTGAGVSVSCGIPDFRSRDGIYARLAVDFPDLPDPQAMFDIHYFRRDPRPFFKFAREIYPGQFTPSLCHRFIRLIEQHNKLLRNYTQNIDTLEQVAGITNVIQCHGSFATATCQLCGHRVEAQDIKEDIFQQRIPLCHLCPPPPKKKTLTESRTQKVGDTKNRRIEERTAQLTQCPHTSPSSLPQEPQQPIMKPDIVFFGEGLPDEFHDKMTNDKDQADLLIVIGSSLKVRPVALIPSSLPGHVPQVLINREPLRHLTFDVELLGDCDVIVKELCHRLGSSWSSLAGGEPSTLTEIKELPPRPINTGVTTMASSETTASPSMAALTVPPALAPHPKDESDLEALRACWAPKVRENIAARLPENVYLFNGSHKYIFPGAEVYIDPDEEFEDDAKSQASSNSDHDDSDVEEDTHDHSQQQREEELCTPPNIQQGNDSDDASNSNNHHRLQNDVMTVASDSVVCGASGTSTEHIEDWTSLNASLDASSLDCDHAAALTNNLDKEDTDAQVAKPAATSSQDSSTPP
ncbi:unnamed protein product, partial [Meganyctiphanes norvegica]